MKASVAPPRGRLELALHLVALVVATCIAFWPALGAEFVNWDDRELLVENTAFRGFTAEHLRWMFTTTHMGPYQPLAWLSFALDHAVGGLDARVFHRTNLVLHAAGAIALYFLARRVLDDLLGRRAEGAPERAEASVRAFAAFVAALLFAVHPLRVESVARAPERRDVLSAPFFFLSLLAWWRYALAPVGGGRRAYALALAALVLSLSAKASAIVMPALLVLLDLGPLRDAARARGMRRIVLEKLPVFAIVVPFAWIAAVGQARDSTMIGAEIHGLATRVVQAFYSAWFYASRSLWPADLQPMHRMPAVERLLEPSYLIPTGVALALTVFAVARWRRLGAPAWAWCAYLVILSPVSGLAQSGAQLVADRYSYLACVPLALLAAWGIVAGLRRAPSAAWAVVLVVAGALAWRANALTRTWHDSWSLWRHALSVDADNDTALINLAVLELETAQTLADRGRARAMLLDARTHAARSAELHPDPRRFFNLAATHVKLADYDPEHGEDHVKRAVETADHARALAQRLGVRIEPKWGVIHAMALYYGARWEDALAIATETLRARPNDADLRRLSADVLGRLGRAKEALTLLEETAKLVPDEPLVWLDLSRAHERAGDPARATEAARKGLERATRAYGARAKELTWYVELAQRAGAR
ncbi:MAG: hypothetical protein IPJ77_06830 [Planctomycetes bacterium]|nr:hypothetical protein [Planctomycetota bacterium]